TYAKKSSRNGPQSAMNVRPRPIAIAITSRARTTHSGSMEMPRQIITPKITARYMTLPIKSAPGLRASDRVGLAGSDNRHRRDLHGRREGQGVRADGHACVLAGCSEHLDEEVGGAVEDLGLVAKALRRQHETEDL